MNIFCANCRNEHFGDCPTPEKQEDWGAKCPHCGKPLPEVDTALLKASPPQEDWGKMLTPIFAPGTEILGRTDWPPLIPVQQAIDLLSKERERAEEKAIQEAVSTLSAMGAAGYKNIDDHTLHSAINALQSLTNSHQKE